MMTYVLTNTQDQIINKKASNHKVRKESIDECDIVNKDVILIILKELHDNNGLFHNFRLYTKLKDKEDYNMLSITTHSLWKLQSEENKVKVAYTRISLHRTINLQVSPNGTVEIYISASRDPYDLHHDIGLSEFFVDLGKIERLIQSEFRYFDPIDRFYEWRIIRVDYNHDIEGLSISHISDKTTILQVKHLSHLFQFYTSKLPNKGLILG